MLLKHNNEVVLLKTLSYYAFGCSVPFWGDSDHVIATSAPCVGGVDVKWCLAVTRGCLSVAMAMVPSLAG